MSITASNISILDDDYRHAVVDMICLFHDSACHLVFATAQLFPAELSAPVEEQPSSHPVKKLEDSVKELSDPNKKRRDSSRLVRCRYVVTAEKALAWYQACLAGEVQLLNGHEQKYQVLHERLLPEPSWPNLVTTEDFVVGSDVEGSLRVHHLMPRECPPLMSQLCDANPAAVAWLSSELNVDFLSNPEQFGSVHLLLPDPVLRDLEIRRHLDKDGVEKSLLRLSPRRNRSAVGLEIMMIEYRPTGVSAIQRVVAQGAYLEIPHAGVSEKFELFVRCPQRGVLAWKKDRQYMRQMHLGLEVTGSQKSIKVPGEDGRSFNVAIRERVSDHVIGEPSPTNGIPARLRKGQYDRQRALEAERLGQKWLHRNQEEATSFVRKLIGEAKHRIWIIDPYFASKELFSFAAFTSYLNTQVTILTGAKTALAKPDKRYQDQEVGQVMLMHTTKSEMKYIQVRVMTGAMPTVHDRFLVIDNDVWFTGNSLNSLGERAGMMIKLPAPVPVIDKISQVLNDPERTKGLEEWVQHRLATRKPDPCSKFVKLLRWARKLKRGVIGMPSTHSIAQAPVLGLADDTPEVSVETEKAS